MVYRRRIITEKKLRIFSKITVGWEDMVVVADNEYAIVLHGGFHSRVTSYFADKTNFTSSNAGISVIWETLLKFHVSQARMIWGLIAESQDDLVELHEKSVSSFKKMMETANAIPKHRRRKSINELLIERKSISELLIERSRHMVEIHDRFGFPKNICMETAPSP